MYSIQSYIQNRRLLKIKLFSKKYPDLIREFEIKINQIELEDSKTIQTTFT